MIDRGVATVGIGMVNDAKKEGKEGSEQRGLGGNGE